MKFRPCIDIHNGKVKQIVGGSLSDHQDFAKENFVSEYNASFYANYYKKRNLIGGHIILLNAKDSDFYQQTKEQALEALKAYPRGLQIGGGMNPENAKEFLDAGASHIILTSYAFQNGRFHIEGIERMLDKIGKDKIVLDLSCKKIDGIYRVVSDRWQCVTDLELNLETLDYLKQYCDEFLIHAVDVEGKANGIEEELAELLGSWSGLPITYAGGVHNFADLEKLKLLGRDMIDVTIGSSLDLFGGNMKFEEVLKFTQ